MKEMIEPIAIFITLFIAIFFTFRLLVDVSNTFAVIIATKAHAMSGNFSLLDAFLASLAWSLFFTYLVS